MGELSTQIDSKKLEPRGLKPVFITAVSGTDKSVPSRLWLLVLVFLQPVEPCRSQKRFLKPVLAVASSYLTQVHRHRDAELTESSVIGWTSRRYAPRCPCSPIEDRLPRSLTRNAVGLPKAFHFASSSLSRLFGHSHQKGFFEQSPLGKNADSSKPH